MLARSCSDDDMVKIPSCEGAMVNGPFCSKAYSMPISARLTSE